MPKKHGWMNATGYQKVEISEDNREVNKRKDAQGVGLFQDTPKIAASKRIVINDEDWGESQPVETLRSWRS